MFTSLNTFLTELSIITTVKALKIFSQIPGIEVVVEVVSVSVVSEFGLKHDADSFPMEANDHLHKPELFITVNFSHSFRHLFLTNTAALSLSAVPVGVPVGGYMIFGFE